MNFLRNAWYAAAWADEVPAGKLLARTFIDEPVVLFRDEANQPRALLDRCPHRFAPLSMGKLCNGGQAVQCGYCFNGMIIKSSELLSKTPRPTEAQIKTAMNGHLCRCGTYPRIMKAIQRASVAMAGGAA